jgi:hypothetical protein
MNEREWWRKQVQPRVNQQRFLNRFLKIQDAFLPGRPDVLFNVHDQRTKPTNAKPRVIGWMELKYRASWPARDSTDVDLGVTPEQLRHLSEWFNLTRDHRTALVLFGVGEAWWLFRHDDEVCKPGSRHQPSKIRERAIAHGETYGSLINVAAEISNAISPDGLLNPDHLFVEVDDGERAASEG